MIVTLIPQLQRISIACKNREHKKYEIIKKDQKEQIWDFVPAGFLLMSI